MHKNLISMLDNLEEIIRSACHMFLKEKVQTFTHKTVNDILTDTDIKMQEYLLERIKVLYPEIIIIAEEQFNSKLSEELSICIDPL
ncbi:MAG: hypothetical protein K2H85_11540, partial [Allobaculum sp.]|nr:hypothetical protein [Allobaculum sp.]